MPDAYVEALQAQQREIERLQEVSSHLVQAYSTLRKDHVCLNVRHHSLLDCLDQTGLLSRPYTLLQLYTNRYVSSFCTLIFEMEDAPHMLVSFAGVAAAGRLSATSRSCMESLAAPLFEAAAASGSGRRSRPVRGGAGRRRLVPSLEGFLEGCRALPPPEEAYSSRSSGRSAASCPRDCSRQGADDTGISATSSGHPIEDGQLGSSSSIDGGSGSLKGLLEELWLNSVLADTVWSFYSSTAMNEFQVCSRACDLSIRKGPSMTSGVEAEPPGVRVVKCNSANAEFFSFGEPGGDRHAADDPEIDCSQGGVEGLDCAVSMEAPSSAPRPCDGLQRPQDAAEGAPPAPGASPLADDPTAAPEEAGAAASGAAAGAPAESVPGLEPSGEDVGSAAALDAAARLRSPAQDEEVSEAAVGGGADPASGLASQAAEPGSAAAPTSTAPLTTAGEAEVAGSEAVEAGAADPAQEAAGSSTFDATSPCLDSAGGQEPATAGADASAAATLSTEQVVPWAFIVDPAEISPSTLLEAEVSVVVAMEAAPPATALAVDESAPQAAKGKPKAKSPRAAAVAVLPSKDEGACGTTWEVVGGAEKGGLVVRKAKDLRSPVYGSSDTGPFRLKPGARVMQLHLQDGRLCYTLLHGEGPQSGWVSTHASGKPLLKKEESKKQDPLLHTPTNEAAAPSPPRDSVDTKAPAADVAAAAVDGKVAALLPPLGAVDVSASVADIAAVASDGVTASGLPMSAMTAFSAVPSWVFEGPPASEARGPGAHLASKEASPEVVPEAEEASAEGGGEGGGEVAEAAESAAAEQQELPEAASEEAEARPAEAPPAAPELVYEGPQLPDTPCVFWTYWDQGEDAMPAFNKLCIETWRATHPDWTVRILDKENVLKWVEEEDLPSTFRSLKLRQHRADCVKSAVMVRFGGIYLDSSIMLWQDISEVTGWAEIVAGHYDYAGYYLHEREFVENYFLAARRGAPLVTAWHNMHLEFWETRTSAGPLDKDAFFRGVRTSRIDPSERSYLCQHACWMKLYDCNIGGFREMTKRAKLNDAAGPKGAYWVFNKLSRMATLQAQKSHQRPTVPLKRGKWLPFGGLGVGLGRGGSGGVGLGKGAGRGLSRGLWGPTPTPRPPTSPGQSWHQALYNMLLWWEASEFNSFLDELDRNKVPLAKFTGHAGFLGANTRKDLLQWNNLIRKLLLKALGESAALPTPTNWTPCSP